MLFSDEDVEIELGVDSSVLFSDEDVEIELVLTVVCCFQTRT